MPAEEIYDDPFAGIPKEFLGEEEPFFTTEEVEEETETKVIEEEEDLTFDNSYKEDFQKLLTLGKLTATFKWANHTFRIRTLTNKELLQIGVLHQPYMGTMSDIRAYATILAAGCLESVDGKQIFFPMSKDDDELESKYKYINENYYSWTIDAIYNNYLRLEAKVEEIIKTMGKV